MASAHTFICEGFVGSDQTRASRFTFCLFEDGVLTVAVAPGTSSAAQVPSSDPVCYVYDGRAAPRTGSPQGDVVFDCSFKIVRFWRHQLQSQFLVCHSQLSASKGLHGRYVVVHGDDDRPHAREVALPIDLNLLLVKHEHEVLREPMRPLTPGMYSFKGYTVTNSGTVYECLVEIVLRADGTLVGKSHDLLFPQRCELQGKWGQDEVAYTLQYKFSTSVSNYLYTVTPSFGGLRGRWTHEDPARGMRRNERGHVELLLDSARRVWSPSFHKLYPREFRDITKLLLLKALRSPARTTYALPSALWQHVLLFCDFHHFAMPGLKQTHGK